MDISLIYSTIVYIFLNCKWKFLSIPLNILPDVYVNVIRKFLNTIRHFNEYNLFSTDIVGVYSNFRSIDLFI